MSTFPDPRPPRRQPPLMEQSFAALGWLHRAAQAVGSPRFPETADRAAFCLVRAARHAHTPAENAVMDALMDSLDALQKVDQEARRTLSEAVSGMDAAEACEFVEMIEQGTP